MSEFDKKISALTVGGDSVATDQYVIARADGSNYKIAGAVVAAAATKVGTLTALTVSGNITASGGTADGVSYLNASKVLTTGASLVFDGTNLGVGGPVTAVGGFTSVAINGGASGAFLDQNVNSVLTSRFLSLPSELRVQTLVSAPISFYTNSTEKMRLDASGNLGVGVTPSARNNTRLQIVDGIGFPATQVASSDANTLDDYEEGTWTPTLPNGGTRTVVQASYTKIGRVVTATLHLESIAPTNNGSEFRFGGLPFPSANTSNQFLGGYIGYSGDSDLSVFTPLIRPNTSYIYFHVLNGNTATRTNANYITAASGSVDTVILSVIYFSE